MPDDRLFGSLETADDYVGLFGLQLNDLLHDIFSFWGLTLTSSAMVCGCLDSKNLSAMRFKSDGSRSGYQPAKRAVTENGGGGSNPTAGGLNAVAVASILLPPTTALVSSIFNSTILFMTLFPSEVDADGQRHAARDEFEASRG
jgi:hypothetical protein